MADFFFSLNDILCKRIIAFSKTVCEEETEKSTCLSTLLNKQEADIKISNDLGFWFLHMWKWS